MISRITFYWLRIADKLSLFILCYLYDLNTCGHFIPCEPRSWKYRNLLCSCDANGLHAKKLTKASISIDNSYFQRRDSSSLTWGIAGKTKDIIFMGMKKVSKRNLHIVKPSCRSMKAIIFRSLRKFTNKLPFLRRLLEGLNEVNRLMAKGEKWNWLSTKRGKNYRLATEKDLTDNGHGLTT